MADFVLTVIVGLTAGYVFLRMRVPGGMMVGSIVGVSVLNIASSHAFMPSYAKAASQIIAGAFIAVGLERSDLKRLRYIFKPAIILISGMAILNIAAGFLICFFSPLDITTSFMSAVPGGISDIPIISEEMGADSSKVAVMQFIRLVFGVGVFPAIINRVSNIKHPDGEEEKDRGYVRSVSKSDSITDLIFTIGIASIFGLIGRWTGIPSATLVFSMLSVIVFKLSTNRGSMPRWMRRFAQVLSGAYIGSSIEMGEVLGMKDLAIPAVILIAGYLSACFLIGFIINKKCKMTLKESMLAATPAGAADMALISADVGVKSADVIVLQIIRMVVVVSVFPQITRFIVSVFD